MAAAVTSYEIIVDALVALSRRPELVSDNLRIMRVMLDGRVIHRDTGYGNELNVAVAAVGVARHKADALCASELTLEEDEALLLIAGRLLNVAREGRLEIQQATGRRL